MRTARSERGDSESQVPGMRGAAIAVRQPRADNFDRGAGRAGVVQRMRACAGDTVFGPAAEFGGDAGEAVVNWVYDKWMEGTDSSPYWHRLVPLARSVSFDRPWMELVTLHRRLFADGEWPKACTALVKEGPKAIVVWRPS
jgi:hypothetical protein